MSGALRGSLLESGRLRRRQRGAGVGAKAGDSCRSDERANTGAHPRADADAQRGKSGDLLHGGADQGPFAYI